MLDPPISQRDIDEGTVFVDRFGEEHVIKSTFPNPAYPWLADDYLSTYRSDGRWVNAGEHPKDLIARKPKESKMSQVCLEDNRRNGRKPVPFDALPQYSVFVAEGTEDHIRVKTVFSDSVLSICPDGTVCTTAVPDGGDWSRCIVRPELRVRIILEDA